MADIAIIEKYPGSYRLDHPDFANVSKTIYAKGVISDFKVDDPDDVIGTIRSQVKVTGNWGESDWIPLFYHPKEQYWDDENAKATDFNREEVNFERAWMSFRCDDEVAVMLKEGIPVAVMGFADGFPRIGENFVKANAYDYPEAIFWGILNGFWEGFRPTSEEKGPDGLDLGLKLVAESAIGGETVYHTSKATYTSKYFYGDTVNWYYREPQIATAKIQVYAVPIGPILFAPYLFYSSLHGDGGTGWYILGGGLGLGPEWVDWVNLPETAENEIIPPPSDGYPVGDVSSPYVTEYGVIAGLTKAGLYSKKLYDKVLSTFGGPVVDDDGNPADDFCPWISELKKQLDSFSATDGVEFTVRPHTKTELQAAGMWPQG